MDEKDEPKLELSGPNNQEISISKSSKVNAKSQGSQNLDKLLDEANNYQQRLFQHLGLGLINGVHIGRRLKAIISLTPHRQAQAVISERFCKPNSLSIRTAQRYCTLADNFERLVEKLRADNPELAELSDEDLLKGMSINKALVLIRYLVSNQAIEIPPPAGVNVPQPDDNDWLTPPDILERVVSLLGVIDLDPCAIPGTNPIPATKTISKPCDGLSSDYDWKGNLFINPGFKKAAFSKWVDRSLHEFRSGNAKEVVLLLPACTNTSYAGNLRDFPRAFTNRPLIVSGPTLSKRSIRLPLMVVFVAKPARFSDFIDVFNDPSSFDVFLPVTTVS